MLTQDEFNNKFEEQLSDLMNFVSKECVARDSIIELIHKCRTIFERYEELLAKEKHAGKFPLCKCTFCMELKEACTALGRIEKLLGE